MNGRSEKVNNLSKTYTHLHELLLETYKFHIFICVHFIPIIISKILLKEEVSSGKNTLMKTRVYQIIKTDIAQVLGWLVEQLKAPANTWLAQAPAQSKWQ